MLAAGMTARSELNGHFTPLTASRVVPAAAAAHITRPAQDLLHHIPELMQQLVLHKQDLIPGLVWPAHSDLPPTEHV